MSGNQQAKLLAMESMEKLVDIAKQHIETVVNNEWLIGFTAFRSLVGPNSMVIESYSGSFGLIPDPGELLQWATRDRIHPVSAIAVMSLAATTINGISQQGAVISAASAFDHRCQIMRPWVADGPVGEWQDEEGTSNFSAICEFLFQGIDLQNYALVANNSIIPMQSFGVDKAV